MLNGKFFTGLPPKMIDRGGAAANRNRLESHLFWPDDTKVETAVECRVKRRNSILEKNNERPLYEKQTSVADNEVDTKKRFNKEFSQSSIQFYDNLNDNRTYGRKSLLYNTKAGKKMEVAEKPTNTKVELPESIVDEAYTTAKKKQAYTSKIEFYDYGNDDREEFQNNRQNFRKPKMDMNDKRDMELNSKNSPKLQVKRDARSLSEEKEQRKLNNCELQNENRTNKDNYTGRERVKFLNNAEGRYSPGRRVGKPKNDYRDRFSSDRDIFREPIQSQYDDTCNLQEQEYEEENLDYEREKRTVRPERKSILKHNTRTSYEPLEDRDCYGTERQIKNKMHAMHLRSPPRKQCYSPEEYYNDEHDDYYDQIRTPTKRGNSRRNNDYTHRECSDADLTYENSNVTINRINNNIEEEQVITSTSPSITEVAKHLRSSLCFNDGAIVADNNDNDYNQSQSPTSTQYPTKRRNARSSATHRISVGLPD